MQDVLLLNHKCRFIFSHFAEVEMHKIRKQNLLDIVRRRRPTSDVNVQSPTRLKIGCRMLKGASGFSHTTGHIISNIFIRPQNVCHCMLYYSNYRAGPYLPNHWGERAGAFRPVFPYQLLGINSDQTAAGSGQRSLVLNTNSSFQCRVFTHFQSNTPINLTSRIQGRLFTKRLSRSDCVMNIRNTWTWPRLPRTLVWAPCGRTNSGPDP